jgi:hypothetical protein
MLTKSKGLLDTQSSLAVKYAGSYCPNILLTVLARLGRLGGVDISVDSTFIGAACILADISGFSKLSGELCQQGANGLELLHHATSGFLSDFVNLIYSYHGDGTYILTFIIIS